MLFSMSGSLTQWCTEIFIDQSSPSIYYMDKSIMADALTLESLLIKTDIHTQEIEFF